jgi:hypothetical protein
MSLRELKEKGIIKVEWIPGQYMVSDVFTKNLVIRISTSALKHLLERMDMPR